MTIELTGWECPKCGAILSPFVAECPHCKPSVTLPAIPITPDPTMPEQYPDMVPSTPTIPWWPLRRDIPGPYELPWRKPYGPNWWGYPRITCGQSNSTPYIVYT